MKSFTIEEIKNYLLNEDSLGDIHCNLSEKAIEKANKKISFTLEEIFQSDANWDQFCEKYGYSEWCVNEGGGNVEVQIFVTDAEKYNLI